MYLHVLKRAKGIITKKLRLLTLTFECAISQGASANYMYRQY